MSKNLKGLQDHISQCHKFSSLECQMFRQNLLSHYDKTKRDLPWRNLAVQTEDVNKRAYAVWVSEIMLQQTQVSTVIDFYNRWMEKWPTISDLAKATIEEVNTLWSGLGYYSRGRRLHSAAQEVMSEMNGEMPKSASELEKKITGVGKYTAGAVASIAYNEQVGVVDGNVIRVLCRIRQIGANSASNSVQNLLWELANGLVCPLRPGDFNQALMELGATVCTPKSPKCSECPVKEICRAYHKNCKLSSVTQQQPGSSDNKDFFQKKKKERNKRQKTTSDIEEVPDCCYCLPLDSPWQPELGVMNFPRKEKKKAPKNETFVSVVLKRSGKYLLSKRPEKGLLAGLWEFPSVKIEENEKLQKDDMIERGCKEIQKRLEIDVSNTTFCYCGEVTHIFSHRHHTYHVIKAELQTNLRMENLHNVIWLDKGNINDVGITKAIHKILKIIDVKNEGKIQGLKRKRKQTFDINNKKQQNLDPFLKKEE